MQACMHVVHMPQWRVARVSSTPTMSSMFMCAPLLQVQGDRKTLPGEVGKAWLLHPRRGGNSAAAREEV